MVNHYLFIHSLSLLLVFIAGFFVSYWYWYFISGIFWVYYLSSYLSLLRFIKVYLIDMILHVMINDWDLIYLVWSHRYKTALFLWFRFVIQSNTTLQVRKTIQSRKRNCKRFHYSISFIIEAGVDSLKFTNSMFL